MDGLNDKGLIIFAWSQREAYCLLPLAVVGKVKDVLKKEGHKCIIGNKSWTLNESSKMWSCKSCRAKYASIYPSRISRFEAALKLQYGATQMQ